MSVADAPAWKTTTCLPFLAHHQPQLVKFLSILSQIVSAEVRYCFGHSFYSKFGSFAGLGRSEHHIPATQLQDSHDQAHQGSYDEQE